MTEDKKTDLTLSEESAKAIFQEILDYYDIEFDDIVNDQGKEGAKTLQNKLIRAIRKGKISTNMHDDPAFGFQIIQVTSTGKTVEYNEYCARAAKDSDKAKGVSESQYRLLGALSGKGQDYIEARANFRGPDLKLAEYIAVIFLL